MFMLLCEDSTVRLNTKTWIYRFTGSHSNIQYQYNSKRSGDDLQKQFVHIYEQNTLLQ